jgi:hypothetical protein
MSQIAQLFNTDAKTLPRRMRGIVHRSKVSGYKTYSISEAASRLVKPGYEIEEFIRQMSPQELPPLLTKEFWNGQNARLNYEKSLGHHWPTDEVVAYLGELTNTIRMSLLLVGDAVDREVGLTDGQREIIRRIMDAAVADLRQSIVDKFKDYHANRPEPRDTSRDAGQGDDEDWNLTAEDEDDDDNIVADADDEDDDGNLLAAEDDEEDEDGI